MVRHRRLSYVLAHPPDDDDPAVSSSAALGEATSLSPLNHARAGGSRSTKGHTLGVNCSAVQADGTVLTGSRDTTVIAWNEGMPAKVYTNHADWVTCLAPVPGYSTHFVTASADHTVALQTADEVFVSRRHCGAVKGVALYGGNRVVTVGMDGQVVTCDIDRELAFDVCIQWRRPLTALAKGSGENPVVYAGSVTGTLYAIDLRAATANSRSGTETISGAHTDTIRQLSMVTHTTLASAGSDGVVRVWDARQLSSPASTLKVHSDSVWALCPIANTATIISGGRDGCVVATNVRSLQSSVLVRGSFPVTHVTTCNRASAMLVCNTSTTVDMYDLTVLLSDELKTTRRTGATAVSAVRASRADGGLHRGGGGGGAHEAEVSFLSPSRISIDCRETAPISELVEADVGVFESPDMVAVDFPDAEARAAWCSAAPLPWRRAPQPPPDVSLAGGPCFVQCQLLPSRRHVAALSTNGRVYVFDICRLTCVYTFTPPAMPNGSPDWEAAMRDMQRHPAHASSWCSATCRWGAVCVTLSAEDCSKCLMTEWEFHIFAKRVLPVTCAAIPPSIRLPSICTLTRAKREKWRAIAPYNLGVELLRGLFRTDRTSSRFPRIVVWSTPNHYTPADSSAGIVLDGPADAGGTSGAGGYQPDDMRIPSWIHMLLAAPGPAASPLPSDVVSVRVIADNPRCQLLPQVQQRELTYARHTALHEVCLTIAKQLKLSPDALPVTKDVNETLRAVGRAPLIGNDTPNDTSRLSVDEFIELLASDGETVLDPLMTMWAAYLAYKEKGASQLSVRYRVLNTNAASPTRSNV